MKSVKIALIAILSVLILGLCVLLGFGLSGRGFGNRRNTGVFADYRQTMEADSSIEGLDSIEIDFSKNSNDVRIYEGNGNTIVVKEYANYDVPEGENSSVSVRGSTLEIKGKRRNALGFHFFYFGNGDGYTEIYLPKEYNGKLDICTASGDVYIDYDLNLEESLNVTVASGDVSVKNIKAAKAGFASASGEIKLQKLEAEEVNITTASGDVWIKEVNGRFRCNTASGKVDIADGCGYGNIGTASGDVKLFLAELTGDLSVSTASGEVTLKLPEDSSFAFDADTASGDIDTFFDDALQFSKRGDHAGGTVGNNASNMEVGVETASGDIRILKAN